MQIRILAFGIAKDIIGSRSIDWNMEGPKRADELKKEIISTYPALSDLASIKIAVNEAYVEDDYEIHENDEVAIIPPVSGGNFLQLAKPVIELSDKPLEVDAILQQVYADDCGAVNVFIGTVRNHTKGKKVERLEFEAYRPMAIREMEKIGLKAVDQWPVRHIVMHHRLGTLGIGEIAVIIGVSTPHRAASFAACQFAIDTLKETVPIWKKEIFEDGEIWVAAHP